MEFCFETWAVESILDEDTIQILKREKLSRYELLLSLSDEDISELKLPLGQRKCLQNGLVSLRKPTAFCIYAKTDEALVETSYEPMICSEVDKVLLLHRDAIPGSDVNNYICQNICRSDTKVIIFFSNDTQKCHLCQYALRLIPNTALKENRCIPIFLQKTTVDKHFDQIESLKIDSRHFERKLRLSLQNRNGDGGGQRYNPNRPSLIFVEKPGVLKLFGRHGGDYRFTKKTSDEHDNRVLFVVLHSGSLKSKFSPVRCLKHAYQKDDQLIDKTAWEKVVKILPGELSQERGDCHDYQWVIRARLPKGVTHMTVTLSFQLLDEKDEIVFEEIVELQTERSGGKCKKKKKRQWVRAKDYDGGDESADDNKQKEIRRYKEQPKKEEQGAQLILTITRKRNSIAILLNADVRKMMLELEKLADENISTQSGLLEFQEACDGYLKTFEVQNRWSEYILVLIKMSGVDHYRKEYKTAKDHLKTALQLLDAQNLPDKEFLLGRAFYYMSAIYRERKKFGKAEKYIQYSQQCLADRECGEDTAKVHYNLAKLYMKMQNQQGSGGRILKRLIYQTLGMALDHFLEARLGADLKQIRRCLLNLSSVKADGLFSKMGTKHFSSNSLVDMKALLDVSQEDITQAERHIRDINGRYYGDDDDHTPRNRMQIAQSEAEVILCRIIHGSSDQSAFKDNDLSAEMGQVIAKLKNAETIATQGAFKESQTISPLLKDLRAIKNKFETTLQIHLCPSDIDNTTNSPSSSVEDEGKCKRLLIGNVAPISTHA